MKLRRFSFALGLCVLAACATSPFATKEMPDLDPSANSFNNDVRWGRWHEAAAHVEDSDRGAFLRLLDDSASPFRFTAVDEISREQTSSDGTEFDVLVALEYYRLPSVQERKVRQRQHWRYDVATKNWVVTPDLSVLRQDVGAPPPKNGALRD
jgi:hypothetical protein